MAQIHEEIVVIKLSKLVKGDTTSVIADDDLLAGIEVVVQELVSNGVVIEIEKA